MSKNDQLRALREAKYARAQAAVGKTPSTRARPPVAPPVDKPAARTKPAKADDAPAADALCGHRNIGGRTCTREAGHAAKSHRYS